MAPRDGSSIAAQLLERAHSPTSAERILLEKVKQRPLHLKPTEPNNAQQKRRAERLRKQLSHKKKQKPKPLSSREKRGMCLYEIPKEHQKYEIYAGLHNLWVGYMHEILNLDAQTYVVGNDMAKLCSADFHGAEVEVVRSRCVSRVGVKGIVVKDTRFTFEIITPGNALKTVPKEHTIFRFTIPRPPPENILEHEGNNEAPPAKDLIFELHGDQFEYRSSDRANRKFKPHFLKDL
ncbi:hypothetical protein BP6252_08430 [Coleophoma cylindrospora]|uniref:Ribonuclease P protein subunit n=1 Tax=Coleophoma cylindrospora TaxID=1849047 RepID=A0A3D8R640_9HELO|nr:hypothetical protein BP6252_08430 [Coleophoma cylindrospora]